MKSNLLEQPFRDLTVRKSSLAKSGKWLNEFSHLFRYTHPVAGAIAYFEYDFPINSTDLIDHLRKEKSVLLVPGDQFSLEKGIRVGFGYDIGKTLRGLALMEEGIRDFV